MYKSAFQQAFVILLGLYVLCGSRTARTPQLNALQASRVSHSSPDHSVVADIGISGCACVDEFSPRNLSLVPSDARLAATALAITT